VGWKESNAVHRSDSLAYIYHIQCLLCITPPDTVPIGISAFSVFVDFFVPEKETRLSLWDFLMLAH